MPSGASPHGSEIAGWPLRLKGYVYGVQVTHGSGAARWHLDGGVKGHDRHGGHEEEIDGFEEFECGAHKRAAITDRLEEARKRIGPRQRAEPHQARAHHVGVAGEQPLVAETSRRHPERLEYFSRQWRLDGHVGIARRHRGGNFRARSGDHGIHRTLARIPRGVDIRPTLSLPPRRRSQRSPSPMPADVKDNGSRASGPAVRSSVRTMSSTKRVNAPAWDSVSVTVPGQTGIRPSVGLKPGTQQKAAGMRIDPPASVPSAMGTAPAATVAAEPALEPPELRSVFQGFRVMPVNGEMPVPFQPNSGVVVLPMMIVPASMRRCTIGAFSLGM